MNKRELLHPENGSFSPNLAWYPREPGLLTGTFIAALAPISVLGSTAPSFST